MSYLFCYLNLPSGGLGGGTAMGAFKDTPLLFSAFFSSPYPLILFIPSFYPPFLKPIYFFSFIITFYHHLTISLSAIMAAFYTTILYVLIIFSTLQSW